MNAYIIQSYIFIIRKRFFLLPLYVFLLSRLSVVELLQNSKLLLHYQEFEFDCLCDVKVLNSNCLTNCVLMLIEVLFCTCRLCCVFYIRFAALKKLL